MTCVNDYMDLVRKAVANMDKQSSRADSARDPQQLLAHDPFYRACRGLFRSPIALGIVIATIIVAMIVFGPSTESRFIYTDF
jgi:hypothetical protein